MSIKPFMNLVLLASKKHERSILEILIEILRLRYSIGRLGISEYFDFRLYEKDLSLEEKKAFCGYRGQAILEEILIDDRSAILSLDKVTMYLLLMGHGFPIPSLRATYGTGRCGPFRCLDSVEALVAYLEEPNALPVYLKPSFSGFGKGNALIREAKNHYLILGDGSQVSINSFCQSLNLAAEFGWILQEPLQAHPDIISLSSEKVSGVRVHTFLSAKGPKITRAIWKINAGKKDFDNFQHGASGNMLGEIDLETGCVKRVVSGYGFDQVINPCHPVTGMKLQGFDIPHWKTLKDLVLDASVVFKGFICQGWDIAICEEGPRILEVNMLGDVDLSQYSHRRGFMDDEFIVMMQDLGFYHLLFGGSKNWQRQKNNGRFGRRRSHWKW